MKLSVQLVELFAREKLTGILVPGYLNPLPPFKQRTFSMMHRDVYLQFESGMLRLRSEETNPRDAMLSISWVDQIDFWFDIDPEYGEEYALTRLDSLLYIPTPCMVTGFTIFYFEDDGDERGRVAAAEFNIGRYKTLFIDPEWIDGILIGNEQNRQNYLSDDHHAGIENIKRFSWAASGS